MLFLSVLIVLALFAVCTEARTGVDLSVATTVDTWQCLMKENSVDYAIIRAYRNVGQIDSNCATTLKNAHNAGVKDLGAYMFPCMPTSAYAASKNITCKSAKDQVLDTIHNLESNGIFVRRTGQVIEEQGVVYLNRIWLDIEDESPATYYDANYVANQQFIGDMVEAMTRLRIPIGIYTTKTYWQNIMGNIEGYSMYPLWYPRYDGVNTMDFFSPFAGWTAALIKQTGGDSGWCSISQVDPDYMEDK